MIKTKIKISQLGIYLASIFSVILWGMSYIWSDKLIEQGIPIEYFVFIRILIAGIFLFLYCLIKGYSIKIEKRDLHRFMLLALFEPLIYFVCETYGIQFTESPTASALIIATTPIFSLAAGLVFFKEKVSLINILGIVICLAGLVMVTICATTVGKYFYLGVLLLLIAVFAEVGHASVTKLVSDRYRPEVIVMFQFLIGSIYLLPLFVTKGLANFEFETYFTWEVWSPILYLSVLCSSIAFSLWVSTIKHLGVAKSSIFLAMIPVVTAVLGFLFGNELLTQLQWLGICISGVGVVMSQYVIKSKNKDF